MTKVQGNVIVRVSNESFAWKVQPTDIVILDNRMYMDPISVLPIKNPETN